MNTVYGLYLKLLCRNTSTNVCLSTQKKQFLVLGLVVCVNGNVFTACGKMFGDGISNS